MLRRLTGWLALAVMLLALVVGAACGSDNKKDNGANTTATASGGTTPSANTTPSTSGDIVTFADVLRKDPSVTKHAVVEWGWMFEKSGVLQGFGDPAGDGVLMAVKEINDAGGFQVGDTIYTIKLIQHDTKSDVANTVAVATELVQDDKVKVIWGPASSGDPEATEVTRRAGAIHICPCPRREVTSLKSIEAVQNDYPLAFQTIAAPSKFLPPGALNTKRDYPQFTSFGTMCANTETGKAFCDFFKNAYEAAGFDLVDQEFFPPETADFSPFLTKMKTKNPDIVLNFVDAGPEQFTLLRQSWQLDVGKFYIAVALPYDLFEALVGGAGIRDKIVAAGATPRTEAQYTSEDARIFFEDKYRPFKGGTLPPAAFAAMLTYDPAYMLVAAMQKAGTVDDPQAIAKALEQVHFDGLGEDNYFFDKRHIIVAGNDSCILYQGQMTCQHNAPPPEPN